MHTIKDTKHAIEDIVGEEVKVNNLCKQLKLNLYHLKMACSQYVYGSLMVITQPKLFVGTEKVKTKDSKHITLGNNV